MKYSLRNMKFSRKMILVFTAMLLVTTVASGIIYYNYVAQEIIHNFYASTNDIMNQLSYSLSSQLSAITRRANSLLTNRTFVTMLTDYLSAPTEKNYTEALGVIGDFLKEFASSEVLVHSAYIHTPRSDFDDFTRNRNRSFSFEDSKFAKAYEQDESRPVRWFPVQEDEIFTRRDMVIPFTWRFSLAEYHGGTQYLIVQISKTALENAVLSNFESLDRVFVLDEEGNPIIGGVDINFSLIQELMNIQGSDMKGEGKPDVKLDGQVYIAMHAPLSVNGWQVFVLKNKDELLRNLEKFRTLILSMLFILLLASVGVMTLITFQLTGSLNELAKRMRSVRDGDMNTRFIYSYHDEVGELAQSFNFMLDEIQNLVEKQNQSIEALRQERNLVAQMQKQKRKAELRALQAQINPHFLYNTLNTITWQAVDQVATEISTLSHALGRFFRLSLSRGAEVISLSEEIDHVKSYMQIQKIRYADRLHYEFSVDAQLLSFPIVKLLLQPLVENSIYHGIKLKEGAGYIQVSAKEDVQEGVRVMRIVVEDDGVGIPLEKLADINDNLHRVVSRQSEGYGIYNVNERLCLYYGKQYGLFYDSVPNVYTRACFSVPLVEGERIAHDSPSDC